jgi:hypothetical protein
MNVMFQSRYIPWNNNSYRLWWNVITAIGCDHCCVLLLSSNSCALCWWSNILFGLSRKLVVFTRAEAWAASITRDIVTRGLYGKVTPLACVLWDKRRRGRRLSNLVIPRFSALSAVYFFLLFCPKIHRHSGGGWFSTLVPTPDSPFS